jgi:hypothetical protein
MVQEKSQPFVEFLTIWVSYMDETLIEQKERKWFFSSNKFGPVIMVYIFLCFVSIYIHVWWKGVAALM